MKKNNKGYRSRVERNSLKNRTKRSLKKFVKESPKKVAMNILYLLVGSVYAIYLLIRVFDNLVAKLFMKLPRWSRAIILWVLVLSNVYHNFDFKVLAKEAEVKTSTITTQQIPQATTTIEKNTQIQSKQEEEYKCTLEHETACKIKIKAEEYGIDWKIAVAISKWETGSWTSNIYNNKNNVGGMYCRGFISYNSLDEGIEAFVSNLKRNYYDMGLNTIENIGSKYCPVGASNDPTGLNKNWVPGVTKFYQELEGK